MIGKISKLIAIFIVSSVLSQKCPIQKNWGTSCPINKPGTHPECAITLSKQEKYPGVFSQQICAGESPYFGGGSFDLQQTFQGDIIHIQVLQNRKNYCSQNPKGIGTNKFFAHCGCSKGCLIRSSYKVYYIKYPITKQRSFNDYSNKDKKANSNNQKRKYDKTKYDQYKDEKKKYYKTKRGNKKEDIWTI